MKGIATAVMMGLCLVPNCIIAEPSGNTVDFEPDCLFPNMENLQPLKTSDRLEKLRAYHARLDFLNDIEYLEVTKPDWQVIYIIEHKKWNKLEDKYPGIIFRVMWLNGDKSWVKMQDLRLHDPLLILRYGSEKNLSRLKGWERVESFVNHDHCMLLLDNNSFVLNVTGKAF
jgi:hypothetical protein